MEGLEQKIAQMLSENTLKLDIRNAGIFRFSSSYRFEKHNHREIEIVYIKSGHCMMGVSEKFVPLQEGDCIVLYPGVPHWFFVDRKESCKIAQLEFCVSVPKIVEEEFSIFQFRQFHKFSNCELIRELIEAISRHYRSTRKNPYGVLQMKLLYLQLFIELSLKVEENKRAVKHSKIIDIINYINENYAYDIQVEELAGQFGISSRYIRKCFQKETGISCSQYLISVRIEKAKEMLWQSSKTVTEIATLTGFNSSQYFARVFQQYVGQTPLEYRNIWKGKRAEERYTIELEKENGI